MYLASCSILKITAITYCNVCTEGPMLSGTPCPAIRLVPIRQGLM